MKKKHLIFLAALSLPATAQGVNLYKHRPYIVPAPAYVEGHDYCLHGNHPGSREIIMCGFTKAECEDERAAVNATPNFTAECKQ